MLNIITITKDDIDGLLRTIKSTGGIRRYKSVEQVIIDSSDDDIKKKIKDAIKDEKGITYYWQKPSGRSAAFNLGLKKVKAGWVWFLNGGDEVYSELNNNLLLDLLSRNNSDAIIFQLKYKGSAKIPKHPQMWSIWPPVLSWIPHPSTIVRKEIYNKYGPFDENLKIAMDYEFWLRCFSKNVIVDLISIPIACFDQTGISSIQNKHVKIEVRKIIRRYLWQIIKKWFYSGYIIIKSFKITSRLFN